MVLLFVVVVCLGVTCFTWGYFVVFYVVGGLRGLNKVLTKLCLYILPKTKTDRWLADDAIRQET